MKLFVYLGIFSRRDSWTGSDISIKGSCHWWERGVNEGSPGELSALYRLLTWPQRPSYLWYMPAFKLAGGSWPV